MMKSVTKCPTKTQAFDISSSANHEPMSNNHHNNKNHKYPSKPRNKSKQSQSTTNHGTIK